jgi:hypothetical protein
MGNNVAYNCKIVGISTIKNKCCKCVVVEFELVYRGSNVI